MIDPFFVGSPIGAFHEGVRLMSEGKIWPDAAVTLLTLGYGLGLALLIGAPISVVLGRWRTGWNAVELPILMLNATPTVALVIPIIVIIGVGPAAKVGARVHRRHHSDRCQRTRRRCCGARRLYPRRAGLRRRPLEVFFKVVLPYSLLAVLSGVRLGVGRALTAVLVGEMYATQQGLGLWVSQGQYGMNADLLTFVTIFVATVGASLIGAVNVLDRSFAKWRA